MNLPNAPRITLSAWFEKHVAIDFLVYFRIVFGGVMLWWAWKYLAYDLVGLFYIEPAFHFHYDGFAWVREWPGEGSRLEFYILVLCSLLIVLGYFYRVAAIVFACGFTHLFLVDKSLYQNHYYLTCLLAWLLAILPANAAFSIDAWQRPTIRRDTAPLWMLRLLQFQIAVPYFFGGIAKLNADWLAGQPMGLALSERTWFPLIGPWLDETWFAVLFAWGGMLLDLLIAPALWWRKTRLFAYLAAVLFHLTNAALWTIGVFPWLMILATAVFFPPDWPRRLWASLRNTQAEIETVERSVGWNFSRRLTALALFFYLGWQCLLPLRHYAFPGNASWTEEGHHFAWHMLLRGKKCGIRYYAFDPRTGRTGVVDLRRYITMHQSTRFGRDPRMIRQLALFIADDLRGKGFPEIEIRVLAWVSLNGRKPQMLMDPRADLGNPRESFQASWILPLTEPLPETPWNAPLIEWERHLKLPRHFQLAQNPPSAPTSPSTGEAPGQP